MNSSRRGESRNCSSTEKAGSGGSGAVMPCPGVSRRIRVTASFDLRGALLMRCALASARKYLVRPSPQAPVAGCM